MNKNKFTPGPWILREWTAKTYDKTKGENIFYKHKYWFDVNSSTQAICSELDNKANAALIAASPEMFEALCSIYGMANLELLLETKYSKPTVKMLMNQMDNAIKKARGE